MSPLGANGIRLKLKLKPGQVKERNYEIGTIARYPVDSQLVGSV